MRIFVTGGRHYQNRDFVFEKLTMLHKLRQVDVLIHGATPTGQGADWLADEWARGHEIPVERYPVDHKVDGPWPAAGPRRNARMLRDSRPDGGVAFEGGRGTADCIRQAAAMGLTVWLPKHD